MKIFISVSSAFIYKNLILIILITFVVNSSICQTTSYNDSIFSKAKLNQLILDGKFDSLFNKQDTLVMVFNLSGSTYRRYDIIRFYKKDDSIYIKPEIRTTIDKEEIILVDERKYNINKNDSLSFECFIKKLQLTLIEIPDSLCEKSVFMSMGVFHKWGKKYYAERLTEEHTIFYNFYNRIMHVLYPDIEEFVPIIILEVVEDE